MPDVLQAPSLAGGCCAPAFSFCQRLQPFDTLVTVSGSNLLLVASPGKPVSLRLTGAALAGSPSNWSGSAGNMEPLKATAVFRFPFAPLLRDRAVAGWLWLASAGCCVAPSAWATCHSDWTYGVQDQALNELLPFGEYVAPERFSGSGTHVLMGLDAWELERLLHRLATTGPNGTGRRDRRSRSRTHILPSSMATAVPSSGAAVLGCTLALSLLGASAPEGQLQQPTPAACSKSFAHHSSC